MKRLLSYYNHICFGLLVVVANLVYHPAFHVAREDADSAGTKSTLTRYVLLIAALLVFPNIRFKKWLRNPEIRRFLFYAIPLGGIVLIIELVAPDSKIITDCGYFFIPFLFYAIGTQFKFSSKAIMFFYILYSVFVLYTGISQVLTYIGSFVIMEQYMVSAKNHMACMLSIGIVGAVYWGFSPINKTFKIVLFSLGVLSFAVLLTIRGRAGTLASLFSFFILLHCYIKSGGSFQKNFIRVLVLAIIILFALLVTGKLSSIINYMYDSFFSSYSGDVTSGRGESNSEGISVILSYPFTGRLGQNFHIAWVHNYLLRVLSDYGLIVGGYLLIPYFYLAKRLYSVYKNQSLMNLQLLGTTALLILFIMSMFEPTYPYSPGSVAFFPFFLYGACEYNT